VPEHLKHVQQSGPGPAAVAVAVVPESELVLQQQQRRLLVPGRLGQQLSQSTLTLSLS